jgi:cysteinyl-tRNA synthetase
VVVLGAGRVVSERQRANREHSSVRERRRRAQRGDDVSRRGAALTVATLSVTAVLLAVGCDRPEPARPEAAPGSAEPGSVDGPSPASAQGLGAAPSRSTPTPTGTARAEPARVSSWVYQLQGYPGDRLDALARSPHQLAVIDLARDAHADSFTAAEIGRLRASGKRVLAYFEIGSMEDFRPEYAAAQRADLLLNTWNAWPQERFGRYWDERWWQRVVRPRLDRALSAGYDGVYLDTPLAYEEIDLALVPGQSRAGLARAMADLIIRISEYAKQRKPRFWIVPQNSPELRQQAGYTAAIDGIGMEELFYLDTDRPCGADFCGENLGHTRALRDAGKVVLAVDYASQPGHVRDACSRYRREGFAGYPAVLALDRISPPCG